MSAGQLQARVLDPAREQRAEISTYMELLHSNSRRLADADVAEAHRHAWINRGRDTADLDGLPERFRQLFRQRRAHAILSENGPHPYEKAD